MDAKYLITYDHITEPIPFGDTLLHQLGRRFFTPGGEVKKHAHMEWFELTVITDGEGEVITNDCPSRVKKGDIYISYPGDFHAIRSSVDNPLKYDFFSFNTKNDAMRRALKGIVNSTGAYEERIISDRRINGCISSAISEFLEKQEFGDELLSLHFNEIIYYVIRGVRRTAPQGAAQHTDSADELCFRIMNYVDTHIFTLESLAVLADKFRYNYSYLSSIFKRTTGNTLNGYYQSRRLDTAKLLLDEGKLKITEIAEMLKYSSLYAFSKAFKNKFGKSPRGYSREEK